MYSRWFTENFIKKISKPYVHIVLGARQTGKSTLIKSLLPVNSLELNLADPSLRNRLLADPGEFIKLCQAQPQGTTVFVDEVQLIPEIFNAVQVLYDQNKNYWKFILCGSSARKLRKAGANMLPGRSMLHQLYPLVTQELAKTQTAKICPLDWGTTNPLLFPDKEDILMRLTYGALPGIITATEEDRADLLKAYAVIHLQEEIAREVQLNKLGNFIRFLEFAAQESGNLLNYAKISQEAGVSLPTIKNYFQILEDMFVGFLLPAYTKSKRKNILSTPKFLFFDLGVRHAAAKLPISTDIILANPGPIFEQWVGIELWKRLNYLQTGKLYYQRTKDGAEIDYIIELPENKIIPLEVKWTQNPSLADCRHLITFIKEHNLAQGYLICRVPYPLQLTEQITALPWQQL